MQHAAPRLLIFLAALIAVFAVAFAAGNAWGPDVAAAAAARAKGHA